jgi:NAD(P)H dehydrogenase (quinone)
MNILIVLAHPESQSFNGHLARLARDSFLEHGHAVQMSDLYTSEFDPCESARHYSIRCNPRCFDAQTEQRFSWERKSLPIEIKKEVQKILWADLLLLQFPLWWFGLPAILKGWMDRVFVYGGLYSSSRRHDRGPCRGKRALMCVTTGSSEAACAYNGYEGDTRLILWPSLFAFRYVGFTVLQPFMIHAARGRLKGYEAEAQNQRLREREQEYKKYLLEIDTAPTVPFNSDKDWDQNGTLKPDAPVFSPFIRHKKALDFG